MTRLAVAKIWTQSPGEWGTAGTFCHQAQPWHPGESNSHDFTLTFPTLCKSLSWPSLTQSHKGRASSEAWFQLAKWAHYTLHSRQRSSEFPDRAPPAARPAPQPEKVWDGWILRFKVFNWSEQVFSCWRLEHVSKWLRLLPLAWNRENLSVAKMNLDGSSFWNEVGCINSSILLPPELKRILFWERPQHMHISKALLIHLFKGEITLMQTAKILHG